MFDKAFLTGCDSNTEWMLDWWFKNYKKHNSKNIPVIFANFGVSKVLRENIDTHFDYVIDMQPHETKNWFLKPEAMIRASKLANKICWIDTDCEILRPIGNIFEYSVENKLSMTEDLPWTKRRGETWHNSGVVLFEGTPRILKEWRDQINVSPAVGDQEVLHAMLRDDPLKKRVYIEDLPNIYNWLRIQLLDGQDSSKKKIIHYVYNKQVLQAMIEWREQYDIAVEEDRLNPTVTNSLGECFLMIANHLAYSHNFIRSA